jgi:hypothetical protein
VLVGLVAATLTCITAYEVWYFTTDLDTVANNFTIPLARVVDLLLSVNGLFWMVPGLVVLRRARWHPVGWMLLATGFGYALSFDMAEPEVWDLLGVPHHWAAWVADGWGNSVSFTFTAVLLTVFPDGLPREPKARRWAWIRIAVALVGLVASGMGTTVGGHEDATFDTQSFPNPTGLGFIPLEVAGWMFLLVLLSMVGGAIALWRRSRHVAEEQRGQYTWVLFPFAIMIATVLVAIPLSGLLGDSVWLAVVFMYFLVPVAFSIAIVRQRLFDIDRIVSRTVSYAAIALVIAAVYAVPVVILPNLLGLSSDLSVAVATLAAAAVFTPVRRRLQSTMARRFDRHRYDAERVVEAFSGRLQTAVDLERVTGELSSAVGVALRPSIVALWLSDPVAAQVK